MAAEPTHTESASAVCLKNTKDTLMNIDSSNASVPGATNVETKTSIEKPAAPSSTATSSKPTKRRIVPVAINP